MQVLILALVLILTMKCDGAGERAMAQELKLTADNNNQAVSLALGGALSVTLDSNATTGFSWQLVADGAPVLTLRGHDYVLEPSAQERTGAGGQEVWRFQAAAAGAAELRLEYRRPWEKDQPPATVYLLHVTVEPAASAH